MKLIYSPESTVLGIEVDDNQYTVDTFGDSTVVVHDTTNNNLLKGNYIIQVFTDTPSLSFLVSRVENENFVQSSRRNISKGRYTDDKRVTMRLTEGSRWVYVELLYINDAKDFTVISGINSEGTQLTLEQNRVMDYLLSQIVSIDEYYLTINFNPRSEYYKWTKDAQYKRLRVEIAYK